MSDVKDRPEAPVIEVAPSPPARRKAGRPKGKKDSYKRPAKGSAGTANIFWIPPADHGLSTEELTVFMDLPAAGFNPMKSYQRLHPTASPLKAQMAAAEMMQNPKFMEAILFANRMFMDEKNGQFVQDATATAYAIMTKHKKKDPGVALKAIAAGTKVIQTRAPKHHVHGMDDQSFRKAFGELGKILTNMPADAPRMEYKGEVLEGQFRLEDKTEE